MSIVRPDGLTLPVRMLPSALKPVWPGLGYVLLPGFIADRCNGASLVARRMIGYEEKITIGAVRKKDNTDPLLRRFLEICMTTLHR